MKENGSFSFESFPKGTESVSTHTGNCNLGIRGVGLLGKLVYVASCYCRVTEAVAGVDCCARLET